MQYAVNVSKPDHVAETLKYTKQHNIRFVIRNTGHDYLGKSTGAGALAVWMHNLQNIEIKDWKDTHYNGKVAKLVELVFRAWRPTRLRINKGSE